MLSATSRKYIKKATIIIKCKSYASIATFIDLYRGNLLQKGASGDSTGIHFIWS
jgi:hypothetical protein